MAYKSTRLLNEAIHVEMDKLRKVLMVTPAGDNLHDVSLANAAAQEHLNELRKLIDELAARADRPTIDDVLKLSPGDYVATMKPLVGDYHRKLMVADRLCQCLNEDLQANATILMLVGDEKTVVRTAHDPRKPNGEIAVEAILATLDGGTKEILDQGVAEAEHQLGIQVPENPQPEGDDERVRLLKEAERVGWDTAEGMALRKQAKDETLRVRYADRIIPDDEERNARAELVIDCDGMVVKDRNNLPVPRPATQEEIDSCVVVKDPGSGVGYEE